VSEAARDPALEVLVGQLADPEAVLHADGEVVQERLDQQPAGHVLDHVLRHERVVEKLVEQHDAGQPLGVVDVVAQDVDDVLEEVLIAAVEAMRAEVIAPVLRPVLDEGRRHAADVRLALEHGDAIPAGDDFVAAGASRESAPKNDDVFAHSLFVTVARISVGQRTTAFRQVPAVVGAATWATQEWNQARAGVSSSKSSALPLA